jgi:hypothetical protein
MCWGAAVFFRAGSVGDRSYITVADAPGPDGSSDAPSKFANFLAVVAWPSVYDMSRFSSSAAFAAEVSLITHIDRSSGGT